MNYLTVFGKTFTFATSLTLNVAKTRIKEKVLGKGKTLTSLKF
jgi:hypothetical protein